MDTVVVAGDTHTGSADPLFAQGMHLRGKLQAPTSKLQRSSKLQTWSFCVFAGHVRQSDREPDGPNRAALELSFWCFWCLELSRVAGIAPWNWRARAKRLKVEGPLTRKRSRAIIMKKTMFTAIACSALVIAGCAHKQEHAKFESNTSAPTYGGTSTTYNDQTYNNQRSAERNSSTYSSSQFSNPQTSTTFSDTTVQNQPSSSDSTLISQVRTAINNDTTLVTIAPSIQVMAKNGTVTLSGNVSNEQQKQSIENLVKGTSGVVTVNNQLQVAPSPTGQSSQSGQSSLYYNSPKQAQGSTSGSGAEKQSSLYSTNSAGVSAGASGESSLSSTNSAQGSFSTQPSSTSPASSSSSSSLSSTNDSSQSSSPQSSSSTDSTDKSGSSSLSSTNSSSENPNLSSSSTSQSPTAGTVGASPSSSLDTNKQSSVSGSAQGGTSQSSDTFSSSGSAQSQSGSKDKDLSATSERGSSRVYSTNDNSRSSGFSSDNTSSASSAGSLNLTVQGSTDADQKLADQVRQELRGDSTFSGSSSRLRISLDNGKATLRGFVKSEDDKQKVEKAVQKITGVTSVQNELRVSASSSSSSPANPLNSK
jgi:osmotically-inducible protein OsmY